MIAVVDYGAGNLFSVQKALEYIGAQPLVTHDPATLKRSDKVILPGVGSFGQAMRALQECHLVEVLCGAIAAGKPFLGICLGMQMLFASSDESPSVPGLAVLPGRVRRFGHDLKVPHLGWNQVEQSTESVLWRHIPDGSYFYFAHSYFVEALDYSLVNGRTDYNGYFPSAVQQGNVFGIQFHPEKSQQRGLQLLANFVAL